MRPKLLAGFALALGAIFGDVGTAAGGTGGLTPVGQESPNVERSTDIYYLILGLTTLIFLVVTTALIVFVVRFRSRGRGREVEGPQIRGHTRLELAWTLVPVLMLVVTAAYVFYKLPGITDIEGEGRDLEVSVEGRQFYWQYTYPNGVIAIDRLRAPAGRVVELKITGGLGDVQHSFWVPPLGGKFDAIPGETNTTSFRADEPGVYEGQCAEFCGIQHAAMLATIEVMPREDFDRWLTAQARSQEEGSSDLGAMTYAGACAKCHGFEAEGLVGPPLAGNPLMADREGLEQVVRNGTGEMPAVGKGWRDRQMDALFRYVRREFGGNGAGTTDQGDDGG